eukprot:11830.XXX_723414_723689_1 [CDS] Oithona nana genome sequencing.
MFGISIGGGAITCAIGSIASTIGFAIFSCPCDSSQTRIDIGFFTHWSSLSSFRFLAIFHYAWVFLFFIIQWFFISLDEFPLPSTNIVKCRW